MLREVGLLNVPSPPVASELPAAIQEKAKRICTQYRKSRSQGVMSLAHYLPGHFHTVPAAGRVLRIADAGLMRVRATMQQRALESIVLSGIHLLGKHFCKVDIKINVQCNI